MKYRIMMLLVLGFWVCQAQQETLHSLLASGPTITLGTFMDFVQVPLAERDDFQIFYHNFIDDLRGISAPEKKNIRQKEIEQDAMNSLEVRHPKWARTLQESLRKGHALYGNAHTFLVRFAAYEQYRDLHMRAHTGMWVRARGLFNQTKEVVSGWFSSWSRSRES